jgi:hypothetical protein
MPVAIESLKVQSFFIKELLMPMGFKKQAGIKRIPGRSIFPLYCRLLNTVKTTTVIISILKNILFIEKVVTIPHDQTTIDQADDSGSSPEIDKQ